VHLSYSAVITVCFMLLFFTQLASSIVFLHITMTNHCILASRVSSVMSTNCHVQIVMYKLSCFYGDWDILWWHIDWLCNTVISVIVVIIPFFSKCCISFSLRDFVVVICVDYSIIAAE